VRKLPLASFRPVGAERAQREALPVAQVRVRRPPGIGWHLLQVAVGIPRPWDGRGGGTVHERVEPLRGRGVAAGIHPVEVERLLDALQIRDRLRAPGVVGAAEDLGRDDGREQPQDEDHHHDLEEGESLATPRAHHGTPAGLSVSTGTRIARTSTSTTPPTASTRAGSSSAVAASRAVATSSSAAVAARPSASPSAPPRSPVAARRTRSGENAPVRAKAVASGSPRRTASAAARVASPRTALPTASAARRRPA